MNTIYYRDNHYRNVHDSITVNMLAARAKCAVIDPKFINYPSPTKPISDFQLFLLGHQPRHPPPPHPPPHPPPPPLLAFNVRWGSSLAYNKSKLVQGDLTLLSITLSNESGRCAAIQTLSTDRLLIDSANEPFLCKPESDPLLL